MIRTNFQWGELYLVSYEFHRFANQDLLGIHMPEYVPVFWFNDRASLIYGPPSWAWFVAAAERVCFAIDYLLYHGLWRWWIGEGEAFPISARRFLQDFMLHQCVHLWVQNVDCEVERPSEEHLRMLPTHVICYGNGSHAGHRVARNGNLWLITTKSGRASGWCCGSCLDEGRLDHAARMAQYKRVREGY